MATMIRGSAAPSPLKKSEAAAIEARVKALEARAGTQVVAAIVERSDVYHGLRWRAFAIAASVAGLAAVLLEELRPAWPAEHTALFVLARVLGSGAAAALAATLLPGFARLFLEPLRADAEVRRRAEALFLKEELFKTRGRNAILILASSFERRAAVYADRGLGERVPDDAWTAATARMNQFLAADRTADALFAGLDAVETLLTAHPAPPGGGTANELPDRPIVAEESR
jgi:putative membrane protein